MTPEQLVDLQQRAKTHYVGAISTFEVEQLLDAYDQQAAEIKNLKGELSEEANAHHKTLELANVAGEEITRLLSTLAQQDAQLAEALRMVGEIVDKQGYFKLESGLDPFVPDKDPSPAGKALVKLAATLSAALGETK